MDGNERERERGMFVSISRPASAASQSGVSGGPLSGGSQSSTGPRMSLSGAAFAFNSNDSAFKLATGSRSIAGSTVTSGIGAPPADGAVAGEEDPALDEELYPCENFNLICKGIYRSAFPKKKNFPFLKKLGLKSILTLILEEYPEQNQKFLDENNITLYQFGVAGNKEPFVDIPEETICAALSVIMDRRNHPLLIHCNKGKHRTGCLVGCLRKIQHWSHTSIFDEYRRFSHPKSRSMDQQFIELFDVRAVLVDPRYLPDWPEIASGLDVRLVAADSAPDDDE